MATIHILNNRRQQLLKFLNEQRISTSHVVWSGLFIRLFIAWSLPKLLDGGTLVNGVEYTDIDYYVFTDAASHVHHGRSPYERHTYRYTPFLAAFLAPLPFEAGRILFCIADTLCGYIIILLRQRQQDQQLQQQDAQRNNTATAKDNASIIMKNPTSTTETSFHNALWWMYNPLAINICTRGSAESLVVLLPVLLTVALVMMKPTLVTPRNTTTSSLSSIQKKKDVNLLPRAFVAGILHGIAVHSKLYPIIYTLSFMAYFATQHESKKKRKKSTTSTDCPSTSTSFPWFEPKRLVKLIAVWIRRLCTPGPLIFFLTFVMTASSLTYLAVQCYGIEALEEGMLYHFSRVDHRHNYSMFWYGIYLTRGSSFLLSSTSSSATATATAAVGGIPTSVLLAWLGRCLMIPQFILLVYISLGVAPKNIGLALFIQTFVLVTHNKVITAQYFTWYLCLLPLCNFQWTTKVQWSLGWLLLSIVTWLGSAYCLEMQGLAVHKMVWMASCLFFCANINLMGALLQASTSVPFVSMQKNKTRRKGKLEPDKSKLE